MRGVAVTTVLAWLTLLVAAAPARAQGEALLAPASEEAAADPRDDAFGPVLVIERIEVVGNASSASRLIRRALPVREGDVLRASDPRLREARFKVLALGYFREVELELRKGSSRGKVILIVTVVERGTIILDRLYFGTTRATPWWAGLALTERNFLGSGIGVGGGLVYAGEGDIEGDADKWAFEMHIGDPSILGGPFGAHAALLYTDTHEPYRVGGAFSDLDPVNFRTFPYTRLGVKGGMSVNVTPLSRLTLDGRVERVRADPPMAPTRMLEDGTSVPVDLGLMPGVSRVVTISIGFDRDTRADPVLPYSGNRLVVLGEFGATFFGGSYDFASALARYEHWWPVRSVEHVLSLHLTGGLVLGNAPLFDRIHVSDMNRMLTPRALGLVVSTRSSRDFLGTSSDEVTYGEVAGAVEVEYSYRLFRSRKHVYGGDLFAGVGLWGLAMANELHVRDRSLYRALPIDLFFDAGLRLDTEIGIFELTLANALGRVPF